MMSPSKTFLTETSQISAEWLERVLRLGDGRQQVAVRQVEIARELHPPFSHAACVLKVTYGNNPDGLPETFFFKIGHRPGEADFQLRFAPRTDSPALAACYHAECANELGMSNLLLEDLSPGHISLPDETHAREAHLLRMAETLAGVHCQWWESPDLQSGPEDLIGFVWNNTREKLASFLDLSGEALTAEHRRLYERIFASLPLPAWTARIGQHRMVTLSHGDAQIRNFLWPVDGQPTPKLIDWALWHVNLPTYDLSYFLALRTPPEQRRNAERDVLQHYLATLAIAGYGREELAADYRLSIIQQTIWPVFFHNFAPPESWLALARNIISAFVDWDCKTLLP